MSRVLANKYGMKHLWTRIFSVYGPFDGEKTMVMSSIRQMLNEKVSPKYTKGEQQWDYIYSKDVAKALYLVASKGRDNEVYNIAQGEIQPLYEYIYKIRDCIDTNIEVKLGEVPYSQNQVMSLRADISKLSRDTGFVSDFSFEEGIVETIDLYKGKFLV